MFAPATEALAVTKRCNKKYYWMVSHQNQNNNYMIYLVDSSGININPIITSIGTSFTYWAGSFKFSSDGNKLATAIYSGTGINDLYDFDTETGALSNLIHLNPQSLGLYWGPEFSFDNSKLYYTENGSIIHQYDLSSGIDSIINNSQTTIANVGNNSTFGTIAKGPDNKLYISAYNDSISTIDSSNVYGVGCNLKINNFSLKRMANIGLPNFTADYFHPANNFNCPTSIVENETPSFNLSFDFLNNKIKINGINTEKITLYDLLGRMVFVQKFSNKNSDIEIEVSNFTKGIYIISLQTKNQIINKKIILN